jgi:hypothetical protein
MPWLELAGTVSSSPSRAQVAEFKIGNQVQFNYSHSVYCLDFRLHLIEGSLDPEWQVRGHGTAAQPPSGILIRAELIPDR